MPNNIVVQGMRQDLTVTSSFEVWTGYQFVTNLFLTSTFIADNASGLTDDLDISSEFSGSTNPIRTLEESLELQSNFSCSLITINFVGTPIPTIDPEPDQVPAATLPHNLNDAGNRNPIYFSFYYPATVLGVTLTAPDFGDSETYKQLREKKYTRGNTLVVFYDISWSEERILEYQFTYLDKSQRDLLLNFMRRTLGYKVRIIDHLGVTRDGFIISPESEVFEPVPKGFSATIRFQQVA